jgi:mono/diheme cytochrome c family protein
MPASRLYSVIVLACLTGLLASSLGTALPAHGAAEPAQPVEFNRDIRAILSDTCFQCHGPDKNKRKANLRLDTEEGAFSALKGGDKAIVPGDPDRSELYRRITAARDKERMPPPQAGRQLTADQKEMIRRWIEQGAKWQKHWAFIPPVRHALPQVKAAQWPRNGLDYFVLARLEKEGLTPSPEAERTTLIRRVTLDLTGLPPTPAEVDRALADTSEQWYERLVDRLLASPHYGERMAARWLDAARYADTNGYQSDGERYMWRWRDWVIDAFNSNMPFDRFTIEQLAGDLLPSPTLEQRIATGFNRNHRGNAEGGIIPEEYAVEYVVDRVETTSAVWLGLTMGCVRCHDHKFDPIQQREFYQLFAYFNNVPEHGRAIKYGNSAPYIQAPTPQMLLQLELLEAKLAAAEKKFSHLTSQLNHAQAEWEHSPEASRPTRWSYGRRLLTHFALDKDTADQLNRAAPARFDNGAPAFVAGPEGGAAALDGKRFLNAGAVGDFGFDDKFALAARVFAQDTKTGTILSRMADTARASGYSVRFNNGKLQANFAVRWLDDAVRIETERALPAERWAHILVTYDGSRKASGIKIYVDGKPEKTTVLLDELNQSFKTKEPFRIGAGGGPEDRLRGAVADVRIYGDSLSAEEAALVASSDPVNAIAALPAAKRSAVQSQKLRAYFLEQQAPERVRLAWQQVDALRRQRDQLVESFPTSMVMEEMPTPRTTHILLRGQYDKPGEAVSPGVPAILPALPADGKNDRLKLARWLVDPSHPLTARVTVNRYWQAYFGSGIVRTVEDFGAQGEWPSHPELLDWLAAEFVRSGWDSKALQKLIVTSATYRQSSRVTKELLYKDPENRLLARGPRFRLPAETIRDQALAASGLLIDKIGGPSVKTYQPAGLWRELGDYDFVQDHGPNLYRRSMYTFWKRTVAPPNMMTFDASGRETCTVRETRTNTPLQALILMNDVTFVEAARLLAQRVLLEGGPTVEERLTLAFRLATGRKPKPAELRILAAGYQHHLDDFRADPKAAEKLVKVGEAPRNPKLDVSELAAYTAMTNLILNLDETITKE